jgi:hypothetical protein
MKIKLFTALIFCSICSFAVETNVVDDISEYGWELLRDPFSPIGYVPPKKVVPTLSSDHSNDQVNWPKLDVTAITKDSDGEYIVFLKGHGMAEKGDIVSVNKDGYSFEYEITEITKKGFKYKKRTFKAIN